MEALSTDSSLPLLQTNGLLHQMPASGCGIFSSAIAVVLLCSWLFSSCRQPRQSAVSAPFYKVSRMKWMFNADTLIKDSYSKFRDRVYQIRSTEGVRVIIPPTLVGELKGLPEDTLSATRAVSEAMLSEYTHLSADAHSGVLTNLLKTKATQNIPRMLPALKEELELIMAAEFPSCEDWTALKIQPFMVRTVSRLSGRAFVGSDLCRSEEWMKVSVNFAITAFVAVIKLQFFPPWMRPVAQYLVSELKTIQQDLAKAQSMLEPLIEERLANANEPGCERPDDFIQWLSDALPAGEKSDYFTQAKMQLLLSASSIHTTSNLTTECIYDVAIHQDMQEVLREEALEVFGQDGSGWGKKDCISRLKKMDSFIKESQRLSGNVTSFIRKVMKPITLSDGTYLPPGTNLLTPLAGVALDERYFPDPEVFDGLRFWRLRQQQQQQKQQQPNEMPSTPKSQRLQHPATSTPPREHSPNSTSSDLKGTTPSDLPLHNIRITATGNPAPANSITLLPSPPQSPTSPSTSTSTSTSLAPSSSSRPSSRPSSASNISHKHQFTSIGNTSQDFGLGCHACPGRFFAAQEIKLILAYLLLNYEIRLPPSAPLATDGDLKGRENHDSNSENERARRPKPIVFMMTKSPCQSAEVLFRKRGICGVGALSGCN